LEIFSLRLRDTAVLAAEVVAKVAVQLQVLVAAVLADVSFSAPSLFTISLIDSTSSWGLEVFQVLRALQEMEMVERVVMALGHSLLILQPPRFSLRYRVLQAAKVAESRERAALVGRPIQVVC
jgi:hypothetical protein